MKTAVKPLSPIVESYLVAFDNWTHTQTEPAADLREVCFRDVIAEAGVKPRRLILNGPGAVLNPDFAKFVSFKERA